MEHELRELVELDVVWGRMALIRALERHLEAFVPTMESLALQELDSFCLPAVPDGAEVGLSLRDVAHQPDGQAYVAERLEQLVQVWVGPEARAGHREKHFARVGALERRQLDGLLPGHSERALCPA